MLWSLSLDIIWPHYDVPPPWWYHNWKLQAVDSPLLWQPIHPLLWCLVPYALCLPFLRSILSPIHSNWFVCLPSHPSIHPSFHPSIHPSACLFVYSVTFNASFIWISPSSLAAHCCCCRDAVTLIVIHKFVPHCAAMPVGAGSRSCPSDGCDVLFTQITARVRGYPKVHIVSLSLSKRSAQLTSSNCLVSSGQ